MPASAIAAAPADLVARANAVIVDQLATAQLESGDLIQAQAAGKFEWDRATELASTDHVRMGEVADRVLPDAQPLYAAFCGPGPGPVYPRAGAAAFDCHRWMRVYKNAEWVTTVTTRPSRSTRGRASEPPSSGVRSRRSSSLT